MVGSSLVHADFTEHAHFHVVQQVAVVSPTAKGIGRHAVTAPRAWRHVDGVFAHHEFAVLVFEVAPHAMEVDGVGHHRVVDQYHPDALAVLEAQRFGVGELHAIERPGELLHVPGEVQLDGATGVAAVRVVEGELDLLEVEAFLVKRESERDE